MEAFCAVSDGLVSDGFAVGMGRGRGNVIFAFERVVAKHWSFSATVVCGQWPNTQDNVLSDVILWWLLRRRLSFQVSRPKCTATGRAQAGFATAQAGIKTAPSP